MTKRKTKPVTFSDNDLQLLEWIEKQGKFATYVKDLIREDMKKHNRENHESFKKEELKDLIKDILKELNIEAKEDISCDLNLNSKSKLGNKAKKAYKNILG